ncbi:peptidoglycan editing factor PgeF [Paenibacillus turpanensis]|uniref:peptidoglycan editing factor PgeF n=1 Tax=Paenibacillus turpanensis TaxID=2689078 RepID=UPI003132E544
MAEPFVWNERAEGPSLFYLQAWMEQSPGLTAGFTSRIGGVSAGWNDSLNCALHVGDRLEDVLENRKRVAEQVGFSFEDWTCAEQVHGNKVQLVTAAEKGRGRSSREDAVAEADALTTREKGVLLTAFFADCVPIWLFDPVTGAVGLAHAGWKGTAFSVAAEAVRSMQDTFGAKPETIRAAIGPSIRSCCYEVDGRVIGELKKHSLGSEAEASAWTPKADGKFMLDLQIVNRQILRKAGILPIHIEITSLCTSCDTKRFYSHRKEQGKTGRMAAWIGWSDKE